MKYVIFIVLGLALLLGCDAGPATTPDLERSAAPTEAGDLRAQAGATATQVSSADVEAFFPAGSYGGGVLTPGTSFPPVKGSKSVLVRNEHWIQYNIHTSGLPAGAYTVWTVVINAPEHCDTSPCDILDLDLYDDPAVEMSIFWSDGGVVQAGGIGNFRARHHTYEIPGELVFDGSGGNGLTDPMGAEVWLVIKYHGPASDDPVVLYEQTHSFLGSCFEGANAIDFGPPFGVECFNPQVAIHTP